MEEEEAVRIFVEFERMESAIKGTSSLRMHLQWLPFNTPFILPAVVDLNGRFFGGRAVRAGFYNLDKFRRLDLADPIE